MRLFYAVEIPEDIRHKLTREIEVLEDYPLKFAHHYQYHITLLFIGEVEPKNVKFLNTAIEKNTFHKFHISLEGMGVFSDKDGAVKVIYKGIGEGTRELTAIHDYLAMRCGESLSNKNRRVYEPHLTLARGLVKGNGINDTIREEVRVISEKNRIYRFNVREIILVNSTLSSKGSEYKVVGKLLLSQ